MNTEHERIVRRDSIEAIRRRSRANYHIEFTHHRGTQVGRAPNHDHLLVFYLPDQTTWNTARERMLAAGFLQVSSYNPYWDREGQTFEDLDGYRVVLQNAAWAR